MIDPIATFSFAEINSIDLKLGGIYAIEHLDKPGFYYIGSAVSFRVRWQTHKSKFNRGKHHSNFLNNVCKKYNYERLMFNVIELIADKTKLVEREQFFINQFNFNILYNSCPIAGNCLGRIQSKETRKKIAELAKGRLCTKETREKISKTQKGKIIPEETRKKMSQARNKITDRQVKQLFDDYMKGTHYKNLCKKYSVSQSFISKIATGKSYSHLNLLQTT
jgi:group I intron endonuclease